jgi:ERCC4-related helicase
VESDAKVKCLYFYRSSNCLSVAESDDGKANTRVMIFSQYRESVHEITEALNHHRPLVRVMSFIGQSSTGKSNRGFSQKDQLKVGVQR